MELIDMVKQGLGDAAISSLVVGLIVSAVVSYLSIAWLLRYLQHHSTVFFVIYRLIFGVAVIAMYNMASIK
jgi:undecaprenyl-diphosphatase